MQTWQVCLCGGEKKEEEKKKKTGEECCVPSEGEGRGEQQRGAEGADRCLRTGAAAVAGFNSWR